MPIEQQQPGNVEAETQVFAKISPLPPEPATVPGVAPVTPAPAPAATTPPATPTAAPAAARKPKSLTRRLARRILGPTLMTKK